MSRSGEARLRRALSSYTRTLGEHDDPHLDDELALAFRVLGAAYQMCGSLSVAVDLAAVSATATDVRNGLKRIREPLESGYEFGAALAESGILEESVVSLIRFGMESGDGPKAASAAAEIYEMRSRARRERAAANLVERLDRLAIILGAAPPAPLRIR